MNIHDLSALERESIVRFVNGAADAGLLGGQVLDYGCGAQPYKGIVRRVGGEYVGYDHPEFLGNVSRVAVPTTGLPVRPTGSWTAVLCTQVIQYVEDPAGLLSRFYALLEPGGGHLVMTYPTTWPEIREDVYRFTRFGMERLVGAAGFTVVTHERRAAIPFDGFELPLGYGIVAAA